MYSSFFFLQLLHYDHLILANLYFLQEVLFSRLCLKPISKINIPFSTVSVRLLQGAPAIALQKNKKKQHLFI